MSTHTFHSFADAGKFVKEQTRRFKADDPRVAGNRKVAHVAQSSVAGLMGGPVVRLRNLGKGGTVRVQAKPMADRSYRVSLEGSGKGIVEKGAKPHTIDAKYKESRAGGGTARGRLRIGNEWRTGPVHHPGVRGHHPFRLGIEAVRPAAPFIYAQEFRKELAKAFR